MIKINGGIHPKMTGEGPATLTNSPLLNKPLPAVPLSYYKHLCVPACACSLLCVLPGAGDAIVTVAAPRTMPLRCDPCGVKATNPAASGGFDDRENVAVLLRF